MEFKSRLELSPPHEPRIPELDNSLIAMAHYGPGMRGHSLSRAHVAARPARGWADGAAARLIGLDPSDGGVGLPVEAQSQCLAGTCAGDPCRSDTPAKLRSRAIITVALIEGPAAFQNCTVATDIKVVFRTQNPTPSWKHDGSFASVGYLVEPQTNE